MAEIWGAVAAAGIGAGTTLATSGGGKTGGGGGSDTGRQMGDIGSLLSVEGAPIRNALLKQVFDALTEGIEPVNRLPMTQRRRSVVANEGSMVRSKKEQELAKAGMANTPYAFQELEDVDRGIASMMADVDVEELNELVDSASELGWKGVNSGIGAMGASTNAEMQSLMLAMQDQESKNMVLSSLGGSAGKAMSGVNWAQLFSTGGSTSGSTSGSNTGFNTPGAQPELG